MKLSNLIIIAIASVCLSVACVSENTITQDLKQTHNNSTTIPKEHAIKSLNAFLNRVGQKTRAKDIDLLKIEVISSRSITRSNGDTLPIVDSLLYIVNFEDNSGYAILSADQRLGTPIIAVTETGSIDTQSFDLGGLHSYEDDISTEIIDRGEETITGTGQIVDNIIVEFVNGRLGDGYNYVGGDDYTYTPPTSPYTVPPILNTIWGQGAPFNLQCPIEDEVRTIAGCVTVAISQVVAHLEKGDFPSGYNYNWDIIKSVGRIQDASEITNNTIDYSALQEKEVSLFVREIGDMCCVNYDDEVSTSLPWKISNCLRDLGYSEVDFYWGYDTNDITNSLLRGIPVFVSASHYLKGHSWVIDGFDGFAIEDESEVLVHCNWGWDGLYNGFYYSGVFNLSNGAIITDINYGDISASGVNNNYNIMFSTVLIKRL